jgi:hypothetical protein
MALLRLWSALTVARQIDPFYTLQAAKAEILLTDYIGGVSALRSARLLDRGAGDLRRAQTRFRE